MNRQKLLSFVRQAVEKYGMIEENDKIAVGVSGGKDSITLLYAMNILKNFYPKKFEIMAITCDVGFKDMNYKPIESFCLEQGINYVIVKTDIYNIVFEKNKDERPCSLCAKLRKGAMYDKLRELGFNKIAYAHNKDDFIETAFMSLIFEGRFYSFPPVTVFEQDKPDNPEKFSVIRPLMYVPEKSVAKFAEDYNLPIVKNRCPIDGATKREYAKNLMETINKENPGSKDRIMHAIECAGFDDWPKINS